MLNKDLVEKLKERYVVVHPLIFHRSLSRAKSDSDLFDILDTIPSKLPIMWSEEARRWSTVDDVFLFEDFNL